MKTGRHGEQEREKLRSAADDLIARKAEALVIACTELSVISDALPPVVTIYDASQVLAEAIVRLAKQEGQLLAR